MNGVAAVATPLSTVSNPLPVLRKSKATRWMDNWTSVDSWINAFWCGRAFNEWQLDGDYIQLNRSEKNKWRHKIIKSHFSIGRPRAHLSLRLHFNWHRNTIDKYVLRECAVIDALHAIKCNTSARIGTIGGRATVESMNSEQLTILFFLLWMCFIHWIWVESIDSFFFFFWLRWDICSINSRVIIVDKYTSRQP